MSVTAIDNNSPIQDSLQCRRILRGRNLIRVRNVVVVAIFVSSFLREVLTWRFREQIAIYTFTRTIKFNLLLK